MKSWLFAECCEETWLDDGEAVWAGYVIVTEIGDGWYGSGDAHSLNCASGSDDSGRSSCQTWEVAEGI